MLVRLLAIVDFEKKLAPRLGSYFLVYEID